MPKTRRAGRKYQLRRIIARYHRASSTDYINIVELNHDDKEYEQLFAGKVTNSESKIKWPAQLTPIDVEDKPYRPTTFHEKDPRGVTSSNVPAQLINGK